MELMDIRWCMASVIRRAQRFMEITSRKCLEGPDMKIGFDKNKVTCFKCKQKGNFKRECTNNKADDSVNPFHDDYYKKAIYHHNKEQPTRKQLDEGSSKENKHVVLTIRDRSESSILQDDKGFNWNDHFKEDGELKAMVTKIKRSRGEIEAQGYLDSVYDAYKEARWANRWDTERDCYVDPKGSPVVDPEEVYFDALVAAIPTEDVWCRGIREIRGYRKKVEEEINKVIYASLEKKKKKTVEEIVIENQKMVKEVKKTADEKLKKQADEVVAEKQQKVEEDLKAEEVTVPNAEVNTQSKSSDLLDKFGHKTDEQCKKCMETCKACTEKDNSLRSRDFESTKIEKIFKEKCNEMLENEKFLKQENEKLTQKCDSLEKENKILK
ncbi:putative transcription factor interactor and regulator CCHC(Zn) family [Helianthus annuus]|nr:putative transcription factor interactor and regulator CCHC(Zn) family [Helianthus annuus]